MSNSTIDDYLASIERTFAPAKAASASVVLQYVFSGRVTGACYVVVERGTLAVAHGTHPSPTATVLADFDLWQQIVSYQIDALLAYQDGLYRVIGDVEALLEADSWFPR